METKICTKCNVEKDTSEFHRHKRMKGGFSSHCKQCRSEVRRVDYKDRSCEICGKIFKPKMSDSLTCSPICSNKLSKLKNKDRVINYNKKYYADNKDSELKRVKKYYRNNKKRVLAVAKKYHKKWSRENKDKIKSYYNPEHRRRYEAKRMATDINYRLAASLRKRICKVVRGQKSKSTLALLGCSLDEFRLHLQNLFQDGMSFENYGEWHIDHKIPCSKFDLADLKDQQTCFHYTNLQPLWAEDNLKKSDKLIFN